MGQAKKRGTKEERVESAKDKKAMQVIQTGTLIRRGKSNMNLIMAAMLGMSTSNLRGK